MGKQAGYPASRKTAVEVRPLPWPVIRRSNREGVAGKRGEGLP
jgi:hypothetical protein